LALGAKKNDEITDKQIFAKLYFEFFQVQLKYTFRYGYKAVFKSYLRRYQRKSFFSSALPKAKLFRF